MKKLLAFFIFMPLLSGAVIQPAGHDWYAEGAKSLYPAVVLPASTTRADRIDRALAWLNQNLPDLSAKDISCVYGNYRESPLGYHITFTQNYKGIAIHDAEIQFNLGIDNRILSVFYKTASSGGWNADAGFPAPDLKRLKTVFPEADTFYRADKVWAVDLSGNPVPSYDVELAKKAGGLHKEILLSIDYQISWERDKQRHNKPKDTTAVAYVFYPDPLTTARVPYKCPYCVQCDTCAPVVDAQQLQKLMEVTATGDSSYLVNSYLRLEELGGPPTPWTYSKNGIFKYSRLQADFGNLMVFYHFNRYHKHVIDIGFPNLANTQIPYDAHVESGDNSWFDPYGEFGKGPALGFGDGGIPDAEDPDVIVHESTHWHIYAAMGQDNDVGDERSALEEAVCDYLACSYSKEITTYNSQWLYNWDGNVNAGDFPGIDAWHGRSCYTTKVYPNDYNGDVYSKGEVWTGSMMEINDALGRDVADRLMVGAMYFLAKNLTLRSAAKIVLQMDSVMYGGVDMRTIATIFKKHGLLPGEYYKYLWSSPENFADFKVVGSYFSSDNLLIVDFGSGQDGIAELLDVQGRQLMKKTFSTSKLTLETPSLSPGVYLLRIRTAKGEKTFKVVKSY